MAITKITVANDDGSTQDFFLPAVPVVPVVPTQTVEVHAGEVVEVKGV